MSSITHRFLCWAPPVLVAAPFVTVCTVAASFPEARPWLIDQFFSILDWWSQKDHVWLAFLLLALTALVVAAWIYGIVRTAPKEPEYADLAHLLTGNLDNQGDSPRPPIVGVLDATEEPDTFQGSIRVGLSGLYVGTVIVALGMLEKEHKFEVAIRAFNGSGKAIRIASIEGHISAGVGNLAELSSLSLPEWISMHTPEPVEPGSEFLVVLHQPLSTEQVDRLLEQLSQGELVKLDLRQLDVMVEEQEEPGLPVRLKLWDGVTLRRRDDVHTGRLSIVTLDPIVINVKAGPE